MSRRMWFALLAAVLWLFTDTTSFAKVAIIDPGTPRATGQETIVIIVKDDQGVTHQVQVRTKDLPDGTDPQQAANEGGIVKGQNDEQKAQAIAKAIAVSPEARQYVTVSTFQGTTLLGPKSGYDIKRVSITDNDTKEDAGVLYTDTADIVYRLPSNDLLMASVRFTAPSSAPGSTDPPGSFAWERSATSPSGRRPDTARSPT